MPIPNAPVRLQDRTGRIVTGTTDANGYYRVRIDGFTAPIVASVTRADGLVWYSPSIAPVIVRGFITINITGLTDKLASDVVMAAGSVGSVQLTPAMLAANLPALGTAKTQLNIDLAAKITAVGLDVAKFDPVTTPFRAVVTDPYDKLLESLVVTKDTNSPTVIDPTFSLGGSIAGLGNRTGLALSNGGQSLTVAANASSFTFANLLASKTSYDITVSSQPTDQTCAVNKGSGTIGVADVIDVAVVCSINSYSVGGSISGLGSASGLVLVNGTETLPVSAGATTFTLVNKVPEGGTYAVTVQTQPTGLTCSVNQGSGTVATASVTNLAVICNANSYTVGGSVTGLGSASGLVLSNSSENLAIAANATTFTFANTAPTGSAYAVTVQTQPTGLICTVVNGSGKVAAGNVGSVTVSCIVAPKYSLGGSITGLGSQTGLTLQNGGETLPISANDSSFTFLTLLSTNTAYNVTVGNQPTGLTCGISKGSGTIASAAVTDVLVNCSTNTYSVGGSISGLGSASDLILGNGTESLPVAANASTFTLVNQVPSGSAYAVTVLTQPKGLNCTVANGSGTVAAANVSSVAVSCAAAPTYSLGGSIAGLVNTGLTLNNGGETLPITANAGSFVFANLLSPGTTYDITVGTQPTGLTCSVTKGSGSIGSAAVTDVAVSCIANTHSVGGSISGLGSASGLVLANGTETLPVAANAANFTFVNAVAEGGAYTVTVQTQPTGLACSVTNGTGTVATANISSVAVNCVVVSQPTRISALTDTGITASQCYAAGSDALASCTSAAALALNNTQDGMIGRDVTTPDNTDGKLGFSYSTVGSNPTTDCVKDNITGLTWEGKPATDALRAAIKTYTNLNDRSAGDASTYVTAVNAAQLCGYSDWRLPTTDELQSLVDYSVAAPGPTIDTTWFPNTQGNVYWTSSPYAGNASYAWSVSFGYGYVVNGLNRANVNHVRLVR